MIRTVATFIVVLFGAVNACAAAEAWSENAFLVLCYHDIPKQVKGDSLAVDQARFIQQIEYMRTHGYSFISLEDVIKANRKEKTLPPKAVLLTFDDAYLTFYEFVYPLLELYGYPSVLAVVSGWLDNPPPHLKLPLMSREQLKEVAGSKLVEIGSHTHNTHFAVPSNPQGNRAPAAVTRIYNPETGTYEDEIAYRQRLHHDFLQARKVLKEEIGVDARTLVWPYGEYNQLCIEEAQKAGFEAMLHLFEQAGLARTNDIHTINRYMLIDNPPIKTFIRGLKRNFVYPEQQRIVQADLDLIYDPDPSQQERNLDQFIERVFNLKPSTVYLQAFCDREGTGNISSVYFPNRVLPMKADLFNRVANRLSIREIKVYAWMPMLSIVLPDRKETADLRVREFRQGKKRLSRSWYQRLSPFSPQARHKLAMLYEDMAINAAIAGVVFQDDGYLNDFEDFHPAAAEEYGKISGDDNIPYHKLNPEQKRKWTRLKTRTLIALTDRLRNKVVRHRPQARFARTLYARVLTHPQSEEWFAQNYADSLAAYDYVVIIAYPEMEEVRRPEKWLAGLVRKAREYPQGLEKTVFKIQTYDWEKESWIKTTTANKWLRVLVASGARHVAYYPDDYVQSKPDDQIIRDMMSVESFPFRSR